MASMTREQIDVVSAADQVYDTKTCPRCEKRLSPPEAPDKWTIRWPCPSCNGWWTVVELRRRLRSV